MLAIPNTIPILLNVDTSSLKKKIPTRIIAIKFNTENIVSAFDKYSNLREYAQATVETVYRPIPIAKNKFLALIDQYLKSISPADSKSTPTTSKIAKGIFIR